MTEVTFHYFNRYDEPLITSCWGATKKEAYKKAYQVALDDGDGDYSIISERTPYQSRGA